MDSSSPAVLFFSVCGEFRGLLGRVVPNERLFRFISYFFYRAFRLFVDLFSSFGYCVYYLFVLLVAVCQLTRLLYHTYRVRGVILSLRYRSSLSYSFLRTLRVFF